MAIALITLSGCSADDPVSTAPRMPQFTINFSHVTTEQTPKGQAALKFAELVEEKSDGRIEVIVHPDSELYGDDDELAALEAGDVQMLAPASSKFTAIAPRLQVLDLPFLFDSAEDVATQTAPFSPLSDAIVNDPDLYRRSIRPLGLWDNGFKQLSANVPLAAPADFVGQRFRIQPSDVLRSQFETWGATAQPLPFAEVYDALAAGAIDGQENTWSNIATKKLNTVQRYVVESDHGYLGYVLVIDDQLFTALPADLQDVVTRSAEEATAYNRQIAGRLNADAKRDVVEARTSTITTWTAAQRTAFADLVVPTVWREYAPVVGPELVNQLLKLRAQK